MRVRSRSSPSDLVTLAPRFSRRGASLSFRCMAMSLGCPSAHRRSLLPCAEVHVYALRPGGAPRCAALSHRACEAMPCLCLIRVGSDPARVDHTASQVHDRPTLKPSRPVGNRRRRRSSCSRRAGGGTGFSKSVPSRVCVALLVRTLNTPALARSPSVATRTALVENQPCSRWLHCKPIPLTNSSGTALVPIDARSPSATSEHARRLHVLSQETHERVLLSFGQGATDEIERTLRIRNM